MLQYLSDLPRQAVHCKWLREQFDARVQDTIMNDRVLGVVTDEQDLDAGMAAAVMKTILSHANLIDCVEPNVQPVTAVLIEDGRIRAILPSGEAGSAGDAQVIDLKGGYLMPGLWDVHIHPDYLSLNEMPLADQVTLFGHHLTAALTESGIVGMRCAGTHHFMDVAWKR